MFTEQFREVFGRFTTALKRSLPALAEEELIWRFLFTVGAMAYTMAMTDEIVRISGGRCEANNVEATIDRLVPFITAGLQTPAPEIAETPAIKDR